MLDFRTPELSDKARIEEYTALSGARGCDATFVNTYLWRKYFKIQVAFSEGAYFKCYGRQGSITGYALPMTSGDLKAAVEAVLTDARERGAAPIIGLLTDDKAAVIRELYGDRVTLKYDREAFDYIYERKALATLGGKKYHAKRNHISKFYRTYDDISFEEICELNHKDVIEVARRWEEDNGETGELEIIRDALEHFEELGMFGLILYVDSKPAAFSIGSRITDELCDVNFEKALDVDGAYAVINNEFAKRFDSFVYINREEDMGLEGLRKSKLSYHPDIMLRKSIAVFKK